MLPPRGSWKPASRRGALLRDIDAKLAELPAAASDAPSDEWVVRALGEAFDCQFFGAVRPARDEAGLWSLGARTRAHGTFFNEYDAALSGVRTPFIYDPLRPVVEQRNRVNRLREIHEHGPNETCVIEDMWPQVGIGGYDQIRALVCDGPVLLAWVGGFREAPFTLRDCEQFALLVPSLKRNLSLQRKLLDAALAAAGLEAALEALGAPSFIVDATGAISHASTSARALVDRHMGETRSRIRDAVTRRPDGSYVARLATEAMPERFLVVLRDDAGSRDARLAEARKQWRLTPRECEVLRGLLAGDANKEIALTLDIHEGSVERHVTSIMRKARCDSRSRLIAKFLTRL